MRLDGSYTLVVPAEYLARITAVIEQGLAILGRPRHIKNGAEADEILRRWCAGHSAVTPSQHEEPIQQNEETSARAYNSVTF